MIDLAQFLETATLFLVAYLLGCILGYATRRLVHVAHMRSCRPVAAPVPPPAAPLPKRTPSPAARLAATVVEPLPPTPRPTPATTIIPPPPEAQPAEPLPPDNLRKIKGIGPKIESSLQALGITRLDQIATWTDEDIARIDGHLAFKGRIRRERWVEQAADLMTKNPP